MTERSDNQDYAIELTPLAVEMLGTVNDRREQAKLRDRIDQLATEPSKQGKALVDNLSGFRSVRAVGQRYRIVYQVIEQTVVVLVVGVGRRKDGDKKDIYTQLTKLLGINE
jgi:mRNA interferase RelE/StbE